MYFVSITAVTLMIYLSRLSEREEKFVSGDRNMLGYKQSLEGYHKL